MVEENSVGSSQASSAPISRRELIKRGGAFGVVAVGGASILAGCGGTTSSSAASSGGGHRSADPFANNAGTPPNPTRGGNLKVAMIGNGSSETYNPFINNSPVDALHCYSVFDPMVRTAPYCGRAPGLVTSWTPNKDATAWELTLRDEVTWHDGKPLTPEDLIYTLRTFALPTSLGGLAVSQVQLRDLKKTAKNIVRVPLAVPIADLQAYFVVNSSTFVVQDGTKSYDKPIGTGPYKLNTFIPGQRSVLTANREYWDAPRPYPDQLEILSIDDPTARYNAFQAGEVDLCLNLPLAVAKANLGSTSLKVVVGWTGTSNTIYMRCDRGPFRDVRVRQAMKLIANRQQLIDDALAGFGTPGKDIMAPGARHFDTDLAVPTQDIEKAKSLLKAAGASDLRVTLDTAEVITGTTSAATAFAQQAAAAGVQIKVQVQQIANYTNPQVLYGHETFAQDAWPGPSLNFIYSTIFLKTAPANETHWYNQASDHLFYKAQAELDPTRAQSLWNQLQAMQYTQGGEIVWSYERSADGASSRVRGFGEQGSGVLYGTDDDRVWNWGLA